MATLTAPKEQRYDRQLRLWGDKGQEMLEKARVCLIRAGAVGSEVLKNLVLPGVGSFTVIDDALVTEADLGNNFFVSRDYLNKPRAQAVTELISELNGDVKGSYVIETADELLENDPNFFLHFSVIVYTDIRESQLLRLSRLVSPAHIPIVICNCIGFMGYLRVSVLEHAIIESHPDATRSDFRLDQPMPTLRQLADLPAFDLDKLPANDLAHVPWLIIIHKFVERFRQSRGHFPSTFAEKQEVRKTIKRAANDLLEKCQARGETIEPLFVLDNFDEACRAVNTAVTVTEISSDVKQLFEDCQQWFATHSEYAKNVASSERQLASSGKGSPAPSPLTNLTMPVFWRLVRALQEFTLTDGGGCLPLRGDIPDMTSDSRRYLLLQKVYRDHAEWAVQRLATRLTDVEGLTLSDIRLLARNAAFLRVIKCRSLEEELKLSPIHSDDLHLIPTHEENEAMLWYFVFRATANFVADKGHFPGSSISFSTSASQGDRALKTARLRNEGVSVNTASAEASSPQALVELSVPLLRSHVNRVLIGSGLAPNSVSDDYIYEMCRFGGGELHSVAALIGGIAAQEVVKLITHQFIPISQPLIYNGITQRTEVLEF